MADQPKPPVPENPFNDLARKMQEQWRKGNK